MRCAVRYAILFLSAAGLGLFAVPTTRGDGDATTQPSADTQAATGTITGTVTKDGKPLANARVGLVDAAQVKARQGKRAKAAGGDAATTDKSQRQRPTPIATAMTDSDGKFMLSDVKAGDYMVIAQVKGEGRGRARASVVSGETATVDISVAPGANAALKPNKTGKAGKAK
jgi:hypothetical protein